MFQDLDKTLATLLDDPAMGTPAMTPPLTELLNADKTFVTPDKTFAPTQQTVDLFLYDVKENRDLRDPVPIVEKLGNSFVRRLPPLRMDCSYIVTAWSNQVAALRVVEEHRLLSQAVQWLSRFPIIPSPYLQGSLVAQPFPPPTMVAQLDPNKNAGEFWDALGIPPRPAFYLTVTIAMDLGLKAEGPLVTTRSTDVDAGAGVPEESWVQIGGRVLTPGGQGIADAAVDILDAGLHAQSADDGRFSFVRVPVGAHNVRVVAAGFQPLTQPLIAPGVPESYDVTLTPL